MEYIDYMRPIVADADTGHGGLSSVMKLVKLFVESGAAGIHMEDQLHGGKKVSSRLHGPSIITHYNASAILGFHSVIPLQCGHQAGKILVPTSTHISRLVASRFQTDIMLSTMLLIARTDSESAKLISSNVDPSDHPFILGTTHAPSDTMPLAEVLANAEASGRTGPEIDNLEAEWMAQHELCTFDQGTASFHPFELSSTTGDFHHPLAVAHAIELSSMSDKSSALDQYKKASQGKSNAEARKVAHGILGEHVVWNWDSECSDFPCAQSHSIAFCSSPYTRGILSLSGRRRCEFSHSRHNSIESNFAHQRRP